MVVGMLAVCEVVVGIQGGCNCAVVERKLLAVMPGHGRLTLHDVSGVFFRKIIPSKYHRL